ncbi:MAG: NUDIX domain-containing protein [bacterium]|nr:NUDIX domain-containing protein [bacterium]
MSKEKFRIRCAVYLVLIKNSKVLLMRRQGTTFYKDFYMMPAGHIEGRETLTQALIRETKEEIGIDLEEKSLKMVHLMHRDSADSEYIDIYFSASKWKGTPKIMEPHKCDDVDWFDIENLPKNTVPYIHDALNSIKNKSVYSESGWK